ncbi:hypothetical protein L1987_74054 [Smallanthus sonchifolius]|uniref:Uncharacterized protein n=1 Tax=Smallanthus sonchifolius TaxID=185202 RepID=A0ACB9A1W0_9ASTR|nr:hypothetical protein L1987_74054 [Smallanthus sonchifolius]
MKRCDLCSHIARVSCQSDNASLCYLCDQTVHSANFLVAKHCRTLLCHKCQSLTPWTASGLHLGRTATVCVDCVNEYSSQWRENRIGQENHGVQEDGETDDDDTESGDESENENDDADAEIQVVPLL